MVNIIYIAVAAVFKSTLKLGIRLSPPIYAAHEPGPGALTNARYGTGVDVTCTREILNHGRNTSGVPKYLSALSDPPSIPGTLAKKPLVKLPSRPVHGSPLLFLPSFPSWALSFSSPTYIILLTPTPALIPITTTAFLSPTRISRLTQLLSRVLYLDQPQAV